MQKAKEKYSKEKVAEYYAQNKEAIKGKLREHYKNKIKQYQRKRYQKLVLYKKEALKNIKKKLFCSLLSIKNEWKNTEI